MYKRVMAAIECQYFGNWGSTVSAHSVSPPTMSLISTGKLSNSECDWSMYFFSFETAICESLPRRQTTQIRSVDPSCLFLNKPASLCLQPSGDSLSKLRNGMSENKVKYNFIRMTGVYTLDHYLI